MSLQRTPEQLTRLWQRILAEGLEGGETPLLGLGIEAVHAENGLGLLALRRLAGHRFGVVEPLIAAGGDGSLWLLALMVWQRAGEEQRPPGASLVYGGNDWATYAASLNLLLPPAQTAGGRTAGMRWMLTPTMLPGAESSALETLPFMLTGSDFAPQTPPLAPSATFWADLEGWAIIGLALALLLAALLS